MWDVGLAGRLARVAEAPRGWATLTAATGLLLIPAALIRVVGSSLLDGRTLAALGWLWPLVLTMVATQAVLTLARGLGARTVVAPIVVYDAIIAASAWIEYAAGNGIALPITLHAVPTAHGRPRSATWPAPRRSGRRSRIGTAAGGAGVPRTLGGERVGARPRGAVRRGRCGGVRPASSRKPSSPCAAFRDGRWCRSRERPRRCTAAGGASTLLPVCCEGMPAPLALRYDTDPCRQRRRRRDRRHHRAEWCGRARALDSLSRVFEAYRADSTLLAVTLGWDCARGAAREPRPPPPGSVSASSWWTR